VWKPLRVSDPFRGAKAAVFIGRQLLVTLRDDKRDIPYPGLWDFPGGGRDKDETPEETLARELFEEVGLDLAGGRILWRRAFPTGAGLVSWFFVLQLPATAEAQIVFGDEGQGWMLCEPTVFLTMPDAVPSLQHRLSLWLDLQN
jgi:8-oxo-dGTP diphosphatase